MNALSDASLDVNEMPNSKDPAKCTRLPSAKPAFLGVAQPSTTTNRRRWQHHRMDQSTPPHASPLPECSSPEHTKNKQNQKPSPALLGCLGGIFQVSCKLICQISVDISNACPLMLRIFC